MPFLATLGAGAIGAYRNFRGAGYSALYVEDLLSTYLYTGTGSTQTITNGFNLVSRDGLVWIKSRSGTTSHALYDTIRGATRDLASDLTTGQTTQATGLTAFENNGFTIGALAKLNTNTDQYASWTFRKQDRFFDVRTVSHTNGTATTVDFSNMGTLGMVIYRDTGTSNWFVWHRSLGGSNKLLLNTTDNQASYTVYSVSDTTVTIASAATTGTKLIYAFAHDAGGFGLTGSDNVISCGTYLGDNHRSEQIVSLGYEPQWVMIKNITTTGQRWVMVDNIRGMCDNAPDAWLVPNSTATETTVDADNVVAASTGFYFSGTQSDVNEAGSTFIYIAIRRGPMKTPTTGTEVFQPIVYTGTNVDNRKVTTNILTDMIMARQRNSSSIDGFILGDRLRGNQYWETGKDSIAVIDLDSLMTPTVGYGNSFSAMDGFGVGNDPTSELNESVVSNNQIVEAFKRAPGFLDIVTYTGTGVARTVNHNLGVKPEMMWIKRLDVAVGTPYMYTSAAMAIAAQNMTAASGFDVLPAIFNDTEPTSTQFTVGTGSTVNASGSSYVAYLMANVPGVSKCSYYVGRGVGTSHQVDCGFSSGVRFLLIKPLEQTGDFHVWDTARGIVAGNDPYLVMNDTIAEVTATDWVDPYSPGFEVTATATSEMNQGYAENWASQNAVAGSSIMEDILYAGGLWVVGSGNGNVYYGASGYSWTAAVAVSGGVNGLGFGNNLYVAVGPSGRISTSPDAVTWTTRTSGVATTLYGVAYGFGKYWVVGSSGTLLSSTDGTTWSSVSSGTGVTIRRIRFLNNNLVIVGDNGTLITSADGTTFTTQTSGTAQDLNDVTFGNGTYAACGDNGTIITSTNLSTWTTRSSGGLSTNLINGIVYAGYRFVAVANGGETGYSNDGTTWSTGAGASTNSLQCVAYGNDIVIAGNNDGDVFPSDVRYWYWAIA